jgi:hypothetical protein
LVVSCAALGLAQFALADVTVDSLTLAQLQGTADFCAQVQPEAAARFEEQTRLMLSEVPAEDLDKVRESDEYKTAYESIRDQLGKIPRKDAAEACKGLLPPES